MNGTQYEPLIEKPIHNGTQKLYRFPNGYGASVVRFSVSEIAGSYGHASGLWELAVLRYRSEDLNDFALTYDTPVTGDVLGWLSDDDVQAKLAEIAALPNPAVSA